MKKISNETKLSIIKYLNNGLSIRKVSELTKVSKSTVERISKDIRHQLPNQILGRPTKLSRRQKLFYISKITKGGRDNAVQVTNDLKSELNTNVSPSTVRRALKDAGLGSMEKPKKPLLSRKNIKDRLEFAKTHQHWTIKDWSKVIWSDETKINRFTSDGCVWCWIRDGEQLKSRHAKLTVKHGGGNIKVWSCITFKGVGWLTKIDNILDKELYQNILKDELMETIKEYDFNQENIWFQHDNDPKHIAHSIREWLSNQKFKVMKWPAQSPDLNPIENMWAILKRRLNQYERPPNRMLELFDQVAETWYNITSEECQKVIETMPQRCQEVIKAKGGWTHY